jgi:hypothetical protein
MTPYKTLEYILGNINTQVLETKYAIKLGQFLKIVLVHFQTSQAFSIDQT